MAPMLLIPHMAIAFLATRPRAMCAPRTLIQYSEFKLDNEALHISTPVNDCCWHVNTVKQTVPLDRIQDVTLSQGCCEAKFGLHSVMLNWLAQPELAAEAIKKAARQQKQAALAAPMQAAGMARNAPGGAALSSRLARLEGLVAAGRLTAEEAAGARVKVLTAAEDPTQPIAEAAGLLDRGAISAAEYAAIKAQWLSAAAASAAAAAPPPPDPVPITLITGYLGAGKTTLVNYVLTAKHGYRCAVLLNEIADSADIERALVKEPEGRDAAPLAEWTELENGCICCSAKNDMVKALESLMQQRSRFDYVLIETTGLANPGPVAAALWTDEQLESSICLDCIVTVVDARHIRHQLADARPEGGVNEAQQQVAFADVVLLNKTDLASEEELGQIERQLRQINEAASVVRCQRCDIDLAAVLNTGMYSKDALHLSGTDAAGTAGAAGAAADAGDAACSEPGCGEAACSKHCEEPGCSDATHHHHHHHAQNHGGGGGEQVAQHDSRIGTVTVHLPGAPLDLDHLRRWLDGLLWEETAEPVDLFRMKGLLHVAGSERKQVLQGVHELYDIVEGPAWAPSERRASKLVFIGRRLRRDKLAADLAACLASPEAQS
ncbi:COBW domain-containing 1-like [Micractinium conductrix]|uniref:COBW domain-containing 1-like n=1 Tax=Micractinium conductrix TaxID=554055 RepID=A0A2P6VBL5_9CHLO|nr:COBW domain-containing 1-like [Micractinium conductrix]|eukprot:PSC71484.1 COBW domain-containing 1-like [Micractinium conductrix]